MRFTLTSIFFLIASFIFFVCWVISSYLVNTTIDSLAPYSSTLNEVGSAHFLDILNILGIAFGVLCALFFVVGILLIFVLESWSDEPEYYYR